MKREELVEKLPEVLNRLEGKGPGSRSREADPVEDLKVFSSFLQYATEQAIENGELSRPVISNEARGPIEQPYRSGDDAVIFDRLRGLVDNGLHPVKLVASRDIPLEDAGKTNPVIGGLEVQQLGQDDRKHDAANLPARAQVTIPIPDDPKNVGEWLPLILWGLPKLQKLIAKMTKK